MSAAVKMKISFKCSARLWLGRLGVRGTRLVIIHRVAMKLLMIVVLLLAVAGCGSGSSPGSSPGAGPSAENDSAAGETSQGAGRLVVYSGRSEDLIGPVLESFQAETGVQVDVRYGETAELAAVLLEEGAASPADVFIAQDAGALGAVAKEGLFAELPASILDKVEPRFRSPDGHWVGVSGRARVVVYNTSNLTEADLPDSILGFTDPKWRGRIGWAPTNGSFQAFVTALRVVEGEDAARQWLEGILANEPRAYPSNRPAVEAVAAGEVDVAFVNHYYLLRLKAEHGDDYPAANYYLKGGDTGAMINVAGAGILRSSQNAAAAQRLLEYLLSDSTQTYFAENSFEFPLVDGVAVQNPDLPDLDEIQTPDIDLSDLSDLERTLELLRDVGAL